MSEVLNQTSEKLVDQIPEKKSAYKTDVFILKILAFVVMSFIVAALVEFPLYILFIVDFIAIFGACVYGRMAGHQEYSQPSKFFENERISLFYDFVPGKPNSHPSVYDFDKRYH